MPIWPPSWCMEHRLCSIWFSPWMPSTLWSGGLIAHFIPHGGSGIYLLGQVQSSDNSSPVSQCWRDDVRFKIVWGFKTRQVAVQCLCADLTNVRKQRWLMHHPAADDDPLRR